MEQFVEILQQIQRLAEAGLQALQGAGEPAEQEAPPGPEQAAP